MSRLLSTPLLVLFTAATMPAAADPALERWFASEPLWILQPTAGVSVALWLDPQNPSVVFVGCSQPGCRATLQLGPEGFQLQDAAGKIIDFEIEDAQVPLFHAREGARLMPSWVVPTGREFGGH